MENKILWSKKYADKKILSVDVNGNEQFTLGLTDGTKVTFSGEHEHDCCEHVYADFSVVNYYEKEMMGKQVQEIVIKAVTDMGFLICIKTIDDSYIKIFIACYNYQNGYYSDNLTLKIKEEDVTTEIDISSYVEEHIY